MKGTLPPADLVVTYLSKISQVSKMASNGITRIPAEYRRVEELFKRNMESCVYLILLLCC